MKKAAQKHRQQSTEQQRARTEKTTAQEVVEVVTDILGLETTKEREVFTNIQELEKTAKKHNLRAEAIEIRNQMLEMQTYMEEFEEYATLAEDNEIKNFQPMGIREGREILERITDEILENHEAQSYLQMLTLQISIMLPIRLACYELLKHTDINGAMEKMLDIALIITKNREALEYAQKELAQYTNIKIQSYIDEETTKQTIRELFQKTTEKNKKKNEYTILNWLIIDALRYASMKHTAQAKIKAHEERAENQTRH